MGQHKMEKEFRNKLNQREIAPSANAWDRLDAMLTVAEEEKPKKDFGWLYIAASILGFLFIGSVYFSQTEEMIDIKREEIVIQNNTPKTSEETPETEIVPTTDSQSIASVETKIIKSGTNNQTKTNHPSDSELAKQSSVKKQINPIQSSNPVEVINQTQKEQLIAENKTPEKAIINQKIEQPVNVKVDELLANAGSVQKSGNPKNSVKVNAKNLLNQVDGELNTTFREKMLGSIKRNCQEVAQAVSNRNTQE